LCVSDAFVIAVSLLSDEDHYSLGHELYKYDKKTNKNQLLIQQIGWIGN